MASGVLLVLLGQAARVSEYLMELAEDVPGDGAAGRRRRRRTTPRARSASEAGPRGRLARGRGGRARRGSSGRSMQTPPAYSAVKVGGRAGVPAGAARRGRWRLKPRQRTRLPRSRLLAFEPPEAEIEVECGKGTYIREPGARPGARRWVRGAPVGADADARRAVHGRAMQLGRSELEAALRERRLAGAPCCRWTAG